MLPGKNDISRNIPLRDGKVPFSANGVGGSYLAQEGVYDFGARDWGPQAVRALLLNNSDALLTIVAAKDANIVTAADLKGKRVAWVVGTPSLNQNITALLDLRQSDVERRDQGQVRRLRTSHARPSPTTKSMPRSPRPSPARSTSWRHRRAALPIRRFHMATKPAGRG